MSQFRKKFFIRLLSALLPVLGLIFLPWAAVFGIALFFSAVFAWFLEIFFTAFIAGILADVAVWKMFLILAPAVFFQERTRAHLRFARPLPAVLWLWAVGFVTFLAVFFIVI